MKKVLIFIYSKLNYLILIITIFTSFLNVVYVNYWCKLLLSILVLRLALKYIVVLKKYPKMNNEILKNFRICENILDEYKISIHENKNQLLMIRNMIKNKNDNTKKYIDIIVENEYKDDENLMMESTKIPSAGLRALIYSKILYMKNNNIKFDLKVDIKLRFIELKEYLILDICKIIGVFLDNAIEETLRIKRGIIKIELILLEEKINISISNLFESFIDLKKISNNRYTTKKEGRGYGLALVKRIVNNNTDLENIIRINNNRFIQILKINT